MDKQDILARLGRPDDRLRGVILRLLPMSQSPANVTARELDEFNAVELFTWSEEEYDNLVSARSKHHTWYTLL